MYVDVCSASLKQLATLDDIGRLLLEIGNVAASCRAALERGADALGARADALRAELAATLTEFDVVMDGTQDLQTEVTDEVGAPAWLCCVFHGRIMRVTHAA